MANNNPFATPPDDETPDQAQMTPQELAQVEANINFLRTVLDGRGPMFYERRDLETRAAWDDAWEAVLDAYGYNSLHALLGILRDLSYALAHQHLGVAYKGSEPRAEYGFAPATKRTPRPPPIVGMPDLYADEHTPSLSMQELLRPLLESLSADPDIQALADELARRQQPHEKLYPDPDTTEDVSDEPLA